MWMRVRARARVQMWKWMRLRILLMLMRMWPLMYYSVVGNYARGVLGGELCSRGTGML